MLSIFGNKNTPDALRAKLAQLESEEPPLVDAYQEAALAAADDTSKQKEADQAHAAMRGHQMNIERTRAALVAAARVEAAQARDVEAGVTAAAWDRFVAASKARESSAALVAKAVADLGKAYAKLGADDRDVLAALPPGVTTHATAGFFGGAEELLRDEFRRHGLPGANPRIDMPATITERYHGFTQRISQARDEAIRSPREHAA